MIRITQALAVAAVAVLSLPSIAAALGVSIVSASVPEGSTLLPGQIVTFDLVVENSSQQDILGLGVTVDGYDSPDLDSRHDGNLRFLSGQAVNEVFAELVIPGVTTNPLTRAGGTVPNELYAINQFNPEAYRTSVWVGADASPHNGTGADDIGLGGSEISAGDVHFQVTFIAFSAGNGPSAIDVNMQFIADVIGVGGAVLDSTGDSFQLRVIPEPGTALLMGLGLAGLAARRR